MRRPWQIAVVALIAAALGYAFAAWQWRRPQRVRAAFHKLFHKEGDRTYQSTWWRGVHTQKCPLDMWVFQEILHETRPDVLVEAGTYKGGSAYYFASLFDLMGRGRVVTIDIEDHKEKPLHPRIAYLLGSSTSDPIVRQVRSLIQPGEKVMVVLDSDHHRDHVIQELRLYSPLVTPGCYLVVEDTHFNGHPILPKYGPGPAEAVAEFLTAHTDFVADRSREKFLMTFNPGGYLKRVR